MAKIAGHPTCPQFLSRLLVDFESFFSSFFLFCCDFSLVNMEFLYVSVGASLQVLLEKFSNFAVKESDQISDIDDKIQKLRRTLLMIESLVDDIDSQRLISCEKLRQTWLQDAMTHIFDAEDLLDQIDLMRPKSDNASILGTHTQVCNANSKINRCPLKFFFFL